MIYDRANWHYDGDFPADVSRFQGYVHIGLFLGWAINNNLTSQEFQEEFEDELGSFKRGHLSGPQLLEIIDGCLTSNEFNEYGNAFAVDYFASHKYFDDYGEFANSNLPSIYHVADNVENFAIVSKILDQRFTEWRSRRDYPLKT